MLVSEKNRLGTAISAVQPRIEAHIAWLEQELDDLDEGLRQALRNSPVWREKDDLLRTVPGVGRGLPHPPSLARYARNDRETGPDHSYKSVLPTPVRVPRRERGAFFDLDSTTGI